MQLKYANSCRIARELIGPSGKVGMRGSLRKKQGRFPSPIEIHEEMRRDKGYAGVAGKRKMAQFDKKRIM